MQLSGTWLMPHPAKQEGCDSGESSEGTDDGAHDVSVIFGGMLSPVPSLIELSTLYRRTRQPRMLPYSKLPASFSIHPARYAVHRASSARAQHREKAGVQEDPRGYAPTKGMAQAG